MHLAVQVHAPCTCVQPSACAPWELALLGPAGVQVPAVLQVAVDMAQELG